MTAESVAGRLALSKAHRKVLQMLADRTCPDMPDPGIISSGETFADRYNVWVHWRTARNLRAKGLIDHPYQDPVDGWSIRLTDRGWTYVITPGRSLRETAREHDINPVGTDTDIETGKRVSPPGEVT